MRRLVAIFLALLVPLAARAECRIWPSPFDLGGVVTTNLNLVTRTDCSNTGPGGARICEVHAVVSPPPPPRLDCDSEDEANAYRKANPGWESEE